MPRQAHYKSKTEKLSDFIYRHVVGHTNFKVTCDRTELYNAILNSISEAEKRGVIENKFESEFIKLYP